MSFLFIFQLIVQNQDFAHTVRQLTFENQALHKQARIEESHFQKALLKQGQDTKHEHEKKISELKQQLKTNEDHYEKVKLTRQNYTNLNSLNKNNLVSK